jgi:CspA family cold shock protein
LRKVKNFDRIGHGAAAGESSRVPSAKGIFKSSIEKAARAVTMMRQTGTVKFFNEQKGFGFIKPDGGGNDIFVHITALQQSGLQNLAEGMRISFETEPDKRGKGPKAVQLRPE